MTKTELIDKLTRIKSNFAYHVFMRDEIAEMIETIQNLKEPKAKKSGDE